MTITAHLSQAHDAPRNVYAWIKGKGRGRAGRGGWICPAVSIPAELHVGVNLPPRTPHELRDRISLRPNVRSLRRIVR